MVDWCDHDLMQESPDLQEDTSEMVERCWKKGMTALAEPEILRATCPTVFLGIDANVDQPLVATGGMKPDLPGGEADFAKAFERVEELGFLCLMMSGTTTSIEL